MLDLVVSQLKGQGFDTSWYADVSMDQNYFNSNFPFFFFLVCDSISTSDTLWIILCVILINLLNLIITWTLYKLAQSSSS